MELAYLFSIATRQGIPFPHAGVITALDQAWLLRIVSLQPVTTPLPTVLDVSTPLLNAALDVRGSVQHWLIRTAEAAVERTYPAWLTRFESEEAWSTVVALRTNPPWQGYLRDTGSTRRGLPISVAKRKHDIRAEAAYNKAVTAWTYAFREDGEVFYQKLQDRAEDVAKANQEFLGLMGLRIRAFLGSVSLHIMLLCGNPDAVRFVGHRDRVTALSFPGIPIIPTANRTAFNQDMMAILARDLYLTLPHPDVTAINLRLDAILETYLNINYDPPPYSFVQVEDRDGGLFLHTRIVYNQEPLPPAAFPFFVPLRQPVAPPGEVVLLADLFRQGLPGDSSIATCTVELGNQVTNMPSLQLWLSRSDAGEPDQRLNLHIPSTLTVGVPPDGVQWRIVERLTFAPPATLYGTITGRVWFTDTGGKESNRARWTIGGAEPRVLPFYVSESIGLPLPVFITLVSDLWLQGAPGGAPLERGHIRVQFEQNNARGIQLFIARTDALTADFQLNAILDVTFDFVALPAGVRWELYVANFTPTLNPLPTLIGGELWFTDTAGFQSNHAGFVITLTP